MNNKNRVDRYSERLEIVISQAQAALRTATLLNGAAAVALLSFIGQFAGKLQPSLELNNALLVFFIGTGLAGLATGLSFVAQLQYLKQEVNTSEGKWAKFLTALNVTLVALSYIFFFGGGLLAYRAFACVFAAN